MEDWIIEAIIEKTGIDREKINQLIHKKREEFPDLSEDAALRMVATDNGVVPIRRNYKIRDITENISHININGRIKKLQEPRAVVIKERPAQVMNLILEDEGGEIGLVVWNEKHIETLTASEAGDILSIANAYSKINSRAGNLELHLGSGSAISITKTRVETNSQLKTPAVSGEASKISDLKGGEQQYLLRGFLVRLFTNKTQIVRCEICKKTVQDTCEIHGDKALSKMLLISGILDDGSGSVRVSFFDKTAQKLLDISARETTEEKLNDLSFGLHQLDVTGKIGTFNDSLTLTARTVIKTAYSI